MNSFRALSLLRFFAFSAILVMPLHAAVPAVEPLKETYTLRDGGVVARFDVALDELQIIAADGEGTVAQIPAQANVDTLALYAAALQAALPDSRVLMVLYESGQPRGDETRRSVENFVVIPGRGGATSITGIGSPYGLVGIDSGDLASQNLIAETRGFGNSLRFMEKLQSSGYPDVELLTSRRMFTRLTPNDPLVPNQFHLADTKVQEAWDIVLGSGIEIGIVDDGLQTRHPDLSANVDTSNDYDFNGRDTDPNPTLGGLEEDPHGTSVGGVAAAVFNNNKGGAGVAPRAKIGGLRLIGEDQTDKDIADAIDWKNSIFDIKNNSWGPPDGTGLTGSGLAGPGALAATAIKNAADNGRGGKGTILVWAGGNGGLADDSNYDGYANSIYAIGVGAVTDEGTPASYTETGANILISAPSNGGSAGVTTTDLQGANGYNKSSGTAGDYTNGFGGTSSAAPVISGVVALMLDADPSLGYRDVQEILLRTAQKIGGAFINNGSGYTFAEKVGAGVVDAKAAVIQAQNWSNLPSERVYTFTNSTSEALTELDLDGVTRTFNVSQDIRVEHVAVEFEIQHTYRGDLHITLTSPSGMVSELAHTSADFRDDVMWTYSSVRHWGERSNGTWIVNVSDEVGVDVGILKKVVLRIYGSTANDSGDTSGGSGGGGGGGSGGGGTGVVNPSAPTVLFLENPMRRTGKTKTVRGTAAGNVAATIGVEKVEYRTRYRDGAWSKWGVATGKSNWSFKAPTPKYGVYYIQVRVTSLNGLKASYLSGIFPPE